MVMMLVHRFQEFLVLFSLVMFLLVNNSIEDFIAVSGFGRIGKLVWFEYNKEGEIERIANYDE